MRTMSSRARSVSVACDVATTHTQELSPGHDSIAFRSSCIHSMTLYNTTHSIAQSKQLEVDELPLTKVTIALSISDSGTGTIRIHDNRVE